MFISRSFLLLSCTLSFAAIVCAAPLTLGDVFEVITDGPGDCTEHLGDRGLLNDMFKNIVNLNYQAVLALKEENIQADANFDLRKLARAFFGILFKDDNSPLATIDEEKLEKARDWYNLIQALLTTIPDPAKKPQLYCDSTFLLPQQGDSIAKDADGDDIHDNNGNPVTLETQSNQNGAFTKKYWYWIPKQNAYLALPKSSWNKPGKKGPFQGKDNYCSQPDTYAWTIEADPLPDADGLDVHRHKATIILCPTAFTKLKEIDKTPVLRDPDTTAQPLGRELDHMETSCLTFYHEMFHLVTNTAEKTFSPDAVTRIPKSVNPPNKSIKHKVISESFPDSKRGFNEDKANTHCGVACMYLALWDLADPAAESIDDHESNKNPETNVWFSLTWFMTKQGDAHQDWSTGACRVAGAPPSIVTATAAHVPRPPPPKRTPVPAHAGDL